MTGISIKDKTVLVTGSNRGIGKSFVLQALAMGEKKFTPLQEMNRR